MGPQELETWDGNGRTVRFPGGRLWNNPHTSGRCRGQEMRPLRGRNGEEHEACVGKRPGSPKGWREKSQCWTGRAGQEDQTEIRLPRRNKKHWCCKRTFTRVPSITEKYSSMDGSGWRDAGPQSTYKPAVSLGQQEPKTHLRGGRWGVRRSRSGRRRVRDGPAFKKLKNMRRRGDHSPQSSRIKGSAFQDLGALHTPVGGEGEKMKVLEGERDRGPIEGSRMEDKRSREQKANAREAYHRGLSGGLGAHPVVIIWWEEGQYGFGPKEE